MISSTVKVPIPKEYRSHRSCKSDSLFNYSYHIIKKLKPDTSEDSLKYIAALAMLEGNWGKSKLVSRHNNPFGRKAGKHQKGAYFRTREVIEGKSIWVQAKFRHYDKVEEAYEDAFKSSRRGYATDPYHQSKIKTIMDSYR